MVRFAATSLLLLICVYFSSCKQQIIQEIHIHEINEILLTAEEHYDNPYIDVECWVDLVGPGFVWPTPNWHALEYADGKPFFFIGDTWWAAPTWRRESINAGLEFKINFKLII